MAYTKPLIALFAGVLLMASAAADPGSTTAPAATDPDSTILPADSAETQIRLAPHSAEYKVKISVLSGRLDTRLLASDVGYEATHSIEPTGMARMLSRGTITENAGFITAPDGVLPVTYRSSDTLSRDKTEADVGFDWAANTVAGKVNGEEVEQVLQDMAHDRVSIQYELMYDLMNGGLSDTYVLFDIDELKVLNVTNIGEQDVKVPAGKYTAVGIQHQAEGSSRVTTLWCVEELGYLPVIIEQHRKGKLTLRATLREYVPD